MQDVVTREAIVCDCTKSGIIYFHRNKMALETGIRNMRLLESDGQEIRAADAVETVRREPTLLGSRQLITGGIFCPTGETAIRRNSRRLWRRSFAVAVGAS
ncbi:hypothetical protein PH562_26995 [Rhizobium sp. CNPSo 4062]|uniref:hypothetical protein n=1 Tax=Rhizobium sp. CNPSo 4062 TaxID=3021410 RepID=UPI00254FCEC2|nr:hypothetical protein [Rhizobium sp. CNPSo 4062]MDK4705922.1 hypothetical protein [Rhizobium sp. CNPSo 4062]